VKENNGAGNGFPPSPTATALSLLPFPDGRDVAGSLTNSEGREANAVLFRSGEGESVKRATASAEAPACIYIVERV
jgi:hypothetical protein